MLINYSPEEYEEKKSIEQLSSEVEDHSDILTLWQGMMNIKAEGCWISREISY